MAHPPDRQEPRPRETPEAAPMRGPLDALAVPERPGPHPEPEANSEAARRYTKQVAVREKRALHAGVESDAKRSRNGLVARLWHSASLGEPWVAPAIREHFACCVAACLANECIRAYLAGRDPGWSRASLESSPVVRVEFEHALVLGRLGESLAAAFHKRWGEFRGVRPLEASDPAHPSRLLIAFKADAPYQRRFEQRRRLRRLLGRGYDRLVGRAMGARKGQFLASLSEDEAARIRARTSLEPGRFWRAVKGRELIARPEPPRQLMLFDID